MTINTNYIAPKASELSKTDIETIAYDIADALNYEPGDELEPIVSKLGGRIRYVDFWELESSDSGSITINAPKDFEIFIANHTSITRDRFTICHELGHYFLHYIYPSVEGRLKATRYGADQTETEANWFSAAFLMPEKKFTVKMAEYGNDIQMLAKFFKVSEAAASFRLDYILQKSRSI